VTTADGFSFLLSDTVGFIRRLPEQLVTAFKATLEELDEADLLLHMIDASHPQVMEQKEAVDTILSELGLSAKPIVEVFNKIDLLTAGMRQSFIGGTTMAPRVAVSALTGYGFDRLLQTVRESLASAASQARAYDRVRYPAVHAQG
jgi:GTP-binding protein HflX